MELYEKLKTACGAPLYVVDMPQARSVAVGILVNAGTRDEEWPREAGLAHAFEHAVFQGTEKFPTSKSLTNYLESVGGDINAWTWKEHTFFYNHVPVKYFHRGLSVLHQMLTAAKFNPDRIKVEMKNIVEEVKRALDDPRDLALMTVDEVMYGHHPLGKRTLGTIEAVTSFTRDDFLRYKDKFYHSSNYTFLVVGNCKKDVARLAINSLSWPSRATSHNLRSPNLDLGRRKRLVVMPKDVKQINICLAAPIGSSNDRSTMALGLFSYMISGGMSFPLFQEIRDKLGLCYEIWASVYKWSDVGNFLIYIGTDVKRWRLALDKIFAVIAKSADSGCLFRKAKKALTGQLLTSGYESPGSLLSKLVNDIVFGGSPKTIEQTIADIQGITLQEVTRAVSRFLRPEFFTKAFVAPKDFRVE